MAVDTQAKRMSIAGINFMPGLSVEADGQETVQIRQAIGYSYAGALTSAFEEQRGAIIADLDGDGGTGAGTWNDEVRDGGVLQPKHVTRISDTVIHVDFPAIPAFDISSQEIVTPKAPAASVVGGSEVVGDTFSVDAVAAGTIPPLDEGMLVGGFQKMAGGL